MANFFDQAGAIWKALDDMVEKDPDAYQRFIKEQMEGAEDFVKSQKSKATKGSEGQSESRSNPKGSTGTGSDRTARDALGLNSIFGKLSQLGIHDDNSDSTQAGSIGTHGHVKSEKGMTKRNTNSKDVKTKASTDTANDADNRSCLLDDEIGNSVIASIVTNDILLGCDEKGNAESEDGKTLVDIKVPSDFTIPKNVGLKKGKPLIQEL